MACIGYVYICPQNVNVLDDKMLKYCLNRFFSLAAVPASLDFGSYSETIASDMYPKLEFGSNGYRANWKGRAGI